MMTAYRIRVVLDSIALDLLCDPRRKMRGVPALSLARF